MKKKNGAEYKLRKQKRINSLNDEIDYLKKEIVKYAICRCFGLMIVLYKFLHLNIYIAFILSLIVAIFVSYQTYKNWTEGCKEEFDRLFEDEDLYFGCDAFYSDSGDDNGD